MLDEGNNYFAGARCAERYRRLDFWGTCSHESSRERWERILVFSQAARRSRRQRRIRVNARLRGHAVIRSPQGRTDNEAVPRSRKTIRAPTAVR